MIEELTKKSEELSKKLEKVGKFYSKYGVYPYNEGSKIVEELYKLTDSIPDVKIPSNQNELFLSELKRRTRVGAINLEHKLNGKSYDLDTIIFVLGIPRSDIDASYNWLKNNRKETLESIERLFQTTDVQNFESMLDCDIPNIREQLEKSAEIDIQKYHKILGSMIQEKTKIGEYLKDIQAVPTTMQSSYFNKLTNILAISIPMIYYSTEDRNLQLKERELIGQYGHEGMGHALNHLVTNSNNLPNLQKRSSSLITLATMESLAEFYEHIIFEDLKDSPETQKELGISNIFNKIYEESKDMRKLEEYKLKFIVYTITVIANKSLGTPDDPEVIRKKAELLSEVALNEIYSSEFIKEKMLFFNSEGELPVGIANPLIYAAQPVKRALEEFRRKGIFYDEKGRSKIDEAFLNGYWTHIGFVENARLKAQE